MSRFASHLSTGGYTSVYRFTLQVIYPLDDVVLAVSVWRIFALFTSHLQQGSLFVLHFQLGNSGAGLANGVTWTCHLGPGDFLRDGWRC